LWVKGEIFRNLADARGSVDGSLDRETQPMLFDRIEWFEATMAHCPPARHVLAARARVEGSDGWLMLAEDGAGRACALSSWYTLRFAPIFTGNPDEKIRHALLTAIARRVSKRLFSIRLAPMTEGDCALVAKAFARSGWTSSVSEKTGNWWIDVSGKSFADYWAERPGELRSTVKRKGAKSGVAITIHREFDGVAWAEYEAIYAESWKGEEGSPPFLRAMAQDAAAHGALRLGIARIGDEAVAAQLWTVENGVAIIHKLAYLPAASEHSPGSLLSAAMFEAAIDTDKVRLIDYGTGDDRYKQDWTDTRTPLFAIELHNLKSPRGIAGAAKSQVAALVGRIRSR
jgi:Acetyltransferase (GNAT) domain